MLGPTENKLTYAISKGTVNIIAAMKRQGVGRLLISAGAGVSDPNDVPGVFDGVMGFLVKRLAKYVYEDMLRTVTEVRASDLDWTIVRVPMLTDGEQTGKVRAGYLGRGVGARLNQADLADFLLKQTNDGTYLRQAPVISN